MKLSKLSKPKTQKSYKEKGALQQLGLTKGAEDVYLMLIEDGASLLSDISKKTRQFRADTYRYISELMEFELIIQIQLGKRKKYEAVSPENIYSILRAKEMHITEGVTSMLKLFDVQQNTFQTETFSSKAGIAALYKIMVEKAKRKAVLCRIESPRDYKNMKKYYPKEYWHRASTRMKGDIEKYVITNPATHTIRQKRLNRLSKSVPKKFFPFEFDYSTVIIEDKVAFIDFETEKAILIRDQRFANYMKAIFWMLYGFLG